MRDFEDFLRAVETENDFKDIHYSSNAIRRHERKKRWEKYKGIRTFSIAVLSFVVVSSSMVFVYAKNYTIPIEQEPIYEEIIVETPNELIAEIYDEDVENAAYYMEAIEPEPYYLQYDVPLDEETLRLLSEACETTGIRIELALSVIWKETRFQNKMGDSGASYGYMQVQPKWHRARMERLGVTDLNDPYSNFLVGCDFLAELLAKYDLPDALTYYNSGSTGCNQYAKDVMNYMENLLTEQN